ncbi:type VI secretion system contractile sheath small subunit [uncultured Desulfovibrio sp.]|uniref:type VI secretion system contractile sheath small subunit n=1 Tax=uncultured Desulfovibrio sp. TaxID=167968 RepID=UPI0025CEBF0D|nr:type VI secretion system contractile sheath small subunit [uncultured Desulfovibrio sp.]
MSKEGSVAPKERVNIVYRPATGDAREEVELPLKIMVLGDFTRREDDRPVEDRAPVAVDKNNFNDVMKGQNLGMTISVPDKLTDGDPDARMAVTLHFDDINDFTPDAIVRQVPELERLLELRESLKALKGPLANVPEFRRRVQEMVSDEKARAALLSELNLDEK